MSFIWRVNKCAHLVTQTVLSPIFGLINYPLLEETKHGEFKVLFRCLIRVRVLLNVIVVAARHLQVHWILHVLQWNGSRQRTEVVVRHRSLPVTTETRVPVKGASSWKYIGTTWGGWNVECHRSLRDYSTFNRVFLPRNAKGSSLKLCIVMQIYKSLEGTTTHPHSSIPSPTHCYFHSFIQYNLHIVGKKNPNRRRRLLCNAKWDECVRYF